MPQPYRTSPVFDADTLPAALRAQHNTKPGVWGVVRVLEGQLRLVWIDPPAEAILTPQNPGIITPGGAHYVVPLGAMRMQVEFYREPPEL